MRPFAVLPALSLLGALAAPGIADARSDKVKVKDDRVVVQDKSKPVRQELEQVYARLEGALERTDGEAILAFRHPDFRTEDCQGRTYSAEAARTGTLSMVSRTQPPIEAGFVLGIIELNGEDEAVVTVRKSFSGMHTMNDGTLRRIATIQTQDDTWVRTPEGWRLRSVQNVRDFEWSVDGKRVEPGKAYHPEAPPYVP